MAIGQSQEYVNSLRRPQAPGAVHHVATLDEVLDVHGFVRLRSQWAPAEKAGASGLPKFEGILRPYGRRRRSPVPIVKPVLTPVGTGQTNVQIVKSFGYGPQTIEDLRIGDTSLNGTGVQSAGRTSFTAYGGGVFEIAEGTDSDPGLSLWTEQLKDDVFSVNMAYEPGANPAGKTRAGAAGGRDFLFEFVFPAGISYKSGTSYVPITAGLRFEYRVVGATTWSALGQKQYLGKNNNQAMTVTNSVSIPAGAGNYEFRVVYYLVNPSTQGVPACQWRRLVTSGPTIPESLGGLTLVYVTTKLQSGVDELISGLNAITRVRLPVWSGSAWGDIGEEEETRNPAAAFLDALRGPANRRALADSRIDLDGLGAWYEECEANDWNLDHDFAGRGTVPQALEVIAAAGRASPQLIDGVRTVCREPDPSTAVDEAVFCPRNTLRISPTKVLVVKPHGLRCFFDNEQKEWERDERLVFADGYNEDGTGGDAAATEYQAKTFEGITHPDHVFALGRYAHAVAEQRPEVVVVEVDWEHLPLTRGSVVRVNDPVMGWGQHWGRVLAVSGNDVHLDAAVDMAVGGAYEVRFWRAGSTSLLRTVTTAPGKRKRITVTSSPTSVAAGDYFTFGTTGLDSVRCLVTRIEHGANLAARLTLVELGTGIYDAGEGSIPAFASKVTIPPALRKPVVVFASAGATGKIQLAIEEPPPPSGRG